MTTDLLNNIYSDYRKELVDSGLKESKATDMFNFIKKAQRPVQIITTTINLDDTHTEEVINKNKGRGDYLSQNPLMKKACKQNGINKSSELRELIYNYWEVRI